MSGYGPPARSGTALVTGLPPRLPTAGYQTVVTSVRSGSVGFGPQAGVARLVSTRVSVRTPTAWWATGGAGAGPAPAEELPQPATTNESAATADSSPPGRTMAHRPRARRCRDPASAPIGRPTAGQRRQRLRRRQDGRRRRR